MAADDVAIAEGIAVFARADGDAGGSLITLREQIEIFIPKILQSVVRLSITAVVTAFGAVVGDGEVRLVVRDRVREARDRLLAQRRRH